MIEFIKILFLAKVIVLTPEPVNIEEKLILNVKPAIKAITTGASIEIDVSEQGQESINDSDMFKYFEFMEEKFPDGSVRIELQNDDQLVVLKKVAYSYSEGKAKLNISSVNGVPKGVAFDRVIINTDSLLKNVIVAWKNYKH